MKKFLHSDWLRAVQLFLKPVQKRVNSVQKEVTDKVFWSVNDQRNSQMANQLSVYILYYNYIITLWWRAELLELQALSNHQGEIIIIVGGIIIKVSTTPS